MSMPTQRLCDLITLGLVIAWPLPAAADWPQFRGPDGQGHATADLPLRWSETENISWKTPIPGGGYSSPVISGNQIWMTSAKQQGESLRAICVDRDTGDLLHDVEVFRTNDPGPKHAQNGYASPTPVLGKDHLYVHFGGQGTACLDRQGNVIWTNRELSHTAIQGSASSPILHGDRLILACDGNDAQFVAALDTRSGKIIWKSERKHLDALARTSDTFKMAFATPLVISTGDQDQVVSPAADHVAAYDVNTGHEVWWKAYEGCSLVARPSFGHGIVFVVGSVKLDNHCLYALRPGSGELTDDQLIWQRCKGVGHVPSPLLVGNELFLIHDDGIVTCVDAETGRQHWVKRLGGRHRSSPIESGGRIYLSNEQGKTHVFAADTTFKLLAVNQLNEPILASPAVSQNAIFLRSKTHLYRID